MPELGKPPKYDITPTSSLIAAALRPGTLQPLSQRPSPPLPPDSKLKKAERRVTVTKKQHETKADQDDDFDPDVDASAADVPVVTPAKNKGKRRSTTPANTPGSSRSIFKKKTFVPIPQSLKDAGEADRMMWQWRIEGKGWLVINAEWERITGTPVGRSTLSSRWIKLRDNFAADNGVDDLLLMQYKEDVEKDLEKEIWKRVAAKFKERRNQELSQDTLRKRYNILRASGWTTSGPLDAKSEHEDQTLIECDVAEVEEEGEVELAGGNTGEMQETQTHPMRSEIPGLSL